jgi:protein SCO1/2
MLSRVFRWIVPMLVLGFLIGSLPGGVPASAKDAQPTAGPKELDDYDVADLQVGGPFTLTDQDGKPRSLAQLKGKVVMMFFGYTYCPDVCPLSMTKITAVQKQLGAQGAATQAVFITVDPARDTPVRMKSFVENFPGKPLGLTGNDAQIAKVAKLFRTKYRRGEERSATDYLMAHTAYLYLLDRKGAVRYMFPPDVDDALLASGARWLLTH